jgi:tetratricopeptide (TPR) repeat protein
MSGKKQNLAVAAFVLGMTMIIPTGLSSQIAMKSARQPGRRHEKVASDKAEATKWINESMKRWYSIEQFDDQYLRFTSADRRFHFGIALARVISVRMGGDAARPGYCTVSWQDYSHDSEDCIPIYGADKFEAGLRFLSDAAREQEQAQQDAALQQFRAQARTWREASAKPAMPEGAREHQVLAEYAFKEKETEKAIREYQAALDIFPTWPEGQFNLATLAGERKYYDTAIFHMKQYLELSPDAGDAQAAKDSIIIWRDRISTLIQAAENNSAPAQPQGKYLLRHASAK